MSRKLVKRFARSTALVACWLVCLCAHGQSTVYRLKLSHHAPPVHHQHTAFVEWAEELRRRSGGRLIVDVYPAQQLGPLSQQYNLVRRGDVDIALVLHGIPAGRFPLTELTHLPQLFTSGEQASRVLMDLVPEYLAAEHRGVRILYLFGHSPGLIHTRSTRVEQPADLQGMRIRHPSSVVGETLRAWGATPVGLAPGEIAQSLDKGVIHGVTLPYDGMSAFRLAPYVRYTTEIFSYVSGFGVLMNSASYEGLPADLRALIDETTGKQAARRVGARWDEMEVPARQYLLDNGVEIVSLDAAERMAFARAAEVVVERRLAAAEARGLPAREFFARVQALARRY